MITTAPSQVSRGLRSRPEKRGGSSLEIGGLGLVSGSTSTSLDLCPRLLAEHVEALVSLSVAWWEFSLCLCLPEGGSGHQWKP